MLKAEKSKIPKHKHLLKKHSDQASSEKSLFRLFTTGWKVQRHIG